MPPPERAAATVFTSGEHCPMCAAAHGWVGLGRIVYVSSSEQLAAWLVELGVPAPPFDPCRSVRLSPTSWWKAWFRSLRNRYATCTGAFTEHPDPQDGDPGTGWLHAGQPLLRLEAANADLVSPSA